MDSLFDFCRRNSKRPPKFSSVDVIVHLPTLRDLIFFSSKFITIIISNFFDLFSKQVGMH